MPILAAQNVSMADVAWACCAGAILKTATFIAYGVCLKLWLCRYEVNSLAFGITRTMLGILLSLICYSWSLHVLQYEFQTGWGLAPVRIILWWFIIWLFFVRITFPSTPPVLALILPVTSVAPLHSPMKRHSFVWRRTAAILIGVGLSYLTDLPFPYFYVY
jgi:hypothetical protein